jgi:hypothetical protein
MKASDLSQATADREFVLPPTTGEHQMPHQIERKFGFRPSALTIGRALLI